MSMSGATMPAPSATISDVEWVGWDSEEGVPAGVATVFIFSLATHGASGMESGALETLRGTVEVGSGECAVMRFVAAAGSYDA